MRFKPKQVLDDDEIGKNLRLGEFKDHLLNKAS
jgi:hypothetical protein